MTTVCRFSFPAMATLAMRIPGIQQQLFRLMSRDIGRASLLAGDFSADERLAAFLVDLGARFGARGYSSTRFNLAMSRADIASHLRLATETVSRVLRRFQDDAIIRVERRSIELSAIDRLRHLARNILR
jgi:CRP/FNR family transcriptional regulator